MHPLLARLVFSFLSLVAVFSQAPSNYDCYTLGLLDMECKFDHSTYLKITIISTQVLECQESVESLPSSLQPHRMKRRFHSCQFFS